MPTPNPEQAFAALRDGGLLHNDPDITQLFDLSQPDYVEQARASKPHLFFDARTAKPEEVEARLREIMRDDRRRGFHRQCDALLAEFREPQPSSPDNFDARTASSAEVEARLARLIGDR